MMNDRVMANRVMAGGAAREDLAYRFVILPPGMREIWCGEMRAFLLAPPGQPARIVSGACPHRGGPLALGQYDCRAKAWRCPWHGNAQKVEVLQRRALPAIRRGAEWVVALGATGDAQPVCLSRHACPAADGAR